MSIASRETQAPQFLSKNDFVTLGDYAHSFYTAPKTSQLREAIAPGTVRRFNDAFQTGNIVPLQTQMNQAEQPLTHWSASIYNMNTMPQPNPPPTYSTQVPPRMGMDYTNGSDYVAIWKP
jgi:hypothetical protein